MPHVPVPVHLLPVLQPHSSQIFCLDLKVIVIYLVDPFLPLLEFLPLMELVVNAEAAHWSPNADEDEPTAARIRLVS